MISDLYEETYINDPDAPYTDVSEIPIQISIDATAVNGKLSTRKLEELDDRFRMLYGACSRTHEQPLIKLEEDTEYKRKTTSRPSHKDEWFIINGFSVAMALLEEEKLHRAGSYLGVIVLPLVEKPKPYCLGGRQRPAGPFHFFETLQGPRNLGPGGPCRYLPRIKIASFY